MRIVGRVVAFTGKNFYPLRRHVPNGFEATEADDAKAMVDKGDDAIKEYVAALEMCCQLYLLTISNYNYSHLSKNTLPL